MIRTAPFFGRGIAFPFRIDPRTGGVKVTEGMAESKSIAIAYLPDQGTIRENLDILTNHIAEAITHILFTAPREHDTLPKFGSFLFHILFEQNAPYFYAVATQWMITATARWEKRAYIEQQGVEWTPRALGIDRGELPVTISPTVIPQQAPENLVSPFVNPRQARVQEYPIGEPDICGHDWTSRYLNAESYRFQGKYFIRPAFPLPVEPAADDIFYEVGLADTWLLISDTVYGDIRYHWLISDWFVQDAADRRESRDMLDTTGDPIPGTLLRLPSKTRLMMEILS
jgi:phage baseplate assembly protein W